MYCLDSNIIIEILNGNQLIKSHSIGISSFNLCTTPITLCELFRGAFLSNNPGKIIDLLNNFLKSLDMIDFDANSCELYGKQYSQLKKIGKLTQDFDLLIAAICISNNKILITKNKKHFESIKGLKVEEWDTV